MPVLAALAVLLAFEWPGALEADARELTSSDDAQRLRVVERLALRDQGRARPLLVQSLQDRDPGVRLVAARVLARAGAPEAIDAATQWILARATRDRLPGLQVLRDAATLPAPARRAVERALGDAEATIRVQALEVLARHGLATSFAAVAAAIDDENREVRLRAARLMADARDARAAVPLLARLGDSDRQVRVEALRALGALDDARVTPSLLRLLSDPSDDVRVAAVDALARLKPPAAVPALVGVARRRPADDLTRRAQLALGEIATPEAIEALLGLVRDPPVTDEVKEALRRAKGAAVPPLVAELAAGTPSSAALAAWALGEIGDRRATAPLAAALDRDRPGSAVAAALIALAALADPEAVPALVRAASAPAAPASDVRRLAFEALIAIGDDRALVLLPRALADADAGVRVRAIRLVVALGATRLAPDVAGRLGDADDEVRREAAGALARIAAPSSDARDAAAGGVVTAILAALARPAPARDDTFPEVLGDALERAVRAQDGPRLGQALLASRGAARAAVARGLAAAYGERPLQDPAVIDQLLALIDEGSSVALAAADALADARLPAGREAPLVRAFGDAEPQVQSRLCAALAASPSGAARLAMLIGQRDLPDEVRAAAAWAASPTEGREVLRAASTDPAPAVAGNARAALAAVGRRSRAAWVGARLAAADGTPWPARWVVVVAGDGTEIWTMTDSTGRVRVGNLPPGPYQLRVVDPSLRVSAAP